MTFVFKEGTHMFYTFKKKIIKSNVDKKKVNQPFDYEKGESFALTGEEGYEINNSYYFSAHSYGREESLYVRLGLRGDSSAEIWVFYEKEGQTYVCSNTRSTVSETPLKVERTQDGWNFTYKGPLTDKEGKDHEADIDCNFSSGRDAIDFFSNMPSIRTAIAMSQDKWTKTFFEEVSKNNQVHYEQEGILKGRVIIDGNENKIVLNCVRDHSYGKRIWDYMNNHLWLMSVGNDYQLNFSMVSYPSMSILEVGNYREEDIDMQYVLKADYHREEAITGNVPEHLSLKLKLDSKKTIDVNVTLLSEQAYPFEEGKYVLHEGIAEFEVEGVKQRGILEIGFNQDSSRFYNGRKVKSIKA